MACGVIALMLELDSTLTNQEVKDILSQTSRQDSNTGTVPNATWGGGKMDALSAIQEVNNRLSLDDQTLNKIKVYPNPIKDMLTIKSRYDLDNVRIYSIDGRLVKKINKPDNSIDLSILNSGVYFLKLKANGITENIKIIKQ